MANILQNLITCVNILCKRITTLEEGGETIECTDFCPVVVAELRGVLSPVDLNPLSPTGITWVSRQSQDSTAIAGNASNVTIVENDACTAHITASVTFVNKFNGLTGNAQNSHPELWLLRNGQRVALSQVFIRDANGADSGTATISWYDTAPVSGTVYSLQVERDSIDNDANGQAGGSLEIYTDNQNANYLQVALHRSVKQCTVTSSGDTGGGTGTPPLSNCGDIVIDGYNANPWSWNMQVRGNWNQSPTPKAFQVVICGQSYTASQLNNVQISGGTVTITQRADGCIVFSGTLSANNQIQMTQPNGFNGTPISAGTATILC